MLDGFLGLECRLQAKIPSSGRSRVRRLRDQASWRCALLHRGFFHGELDDDEMAQARAAYAQRLEAISPRLPAPVLKLAGLNLHDASIEDVRWEPAIKRLRLSLLTLDPPSRYQAVALTYSGALLGEQRICTLRDVARDARQ